MTDEETAEALLKITHLLIRADNLFGEMNKDFLTIYEVDELLALAKKLKVEAER